MDAKKAKPTATVPQVSFSGLAKTKAKTGSNRDTRQWLIQQPELLEEQAGLFTKWPAPVEQMRARLKSVDPYDEMDTLDYERFFLAGWNYKGYKSASLEVFEDVDWGLLLLSRFEFPVINEFPNRWDVQRRHNEGDDHIILKHSVACFLRNIGFNCIFEAKCSCGIVDVVATVDEVRLLVECGSTHPRRVLHALDTEATGFLFVPFWSKSEETLSAYLFERALSYRGLSVPQEQVTA